VTNNPFKFRKTFKLEVTIENASPVVTVAEIVETLRKHEDVVDVNIIDMKMSDKFRSIWYH
jgi:ACT domain-containing protein